MGTPNNRAGVDETGRARTINRKKFVRAELETILDDADSPQSQVLDGYRRLLAVRREQPAFHPDASQRVLQTEAPALVALVRESTDPSQRLLILANLGSQTLPVDVESLIGSQPQRDLLGQCEAEPSVRLRPYQIAWFEI
jgi:sucrose phosphorylase